MHKFLKIFIIIIIICLSQYTHSFSNEDKIKIGLLVPMTGENKNLGQLIIKSTRMALKDIGNSNIEIYPKDTNSNANKTLQSAIELKEIGVKIIVGPIFFKNLIYLDEVEDIIFLSLTNKTIKLPKNVISNKIKYGCSIVKWFSPVELLLIDDNAPEIYYF